MCETARRQELKCSVSIVNSTTPVVKLLLPLLFVFCLSVCAHATKNECGGGDVELIQMRLWDDNILF